MNINLNWIPEIKQPLVRNIEYTYLNSFRDEVQSFSEIRYLEFIQDRGREGV